MVTLLQSHSHSSKLVKLIGARAGAERGGGLNQGVGKKFHLSFEIQTNPCFRGDSPPKQFDDDISKDGHEQRVGRHYADSSVSHKCHQNLFLDSYYNQIYGMRFAD